MEKEDMIRILRENGVRENVINYAFDENRHDCPLLYYGICELKKAGVIKVDDEKFVKSMIAIAKVLID